MANQYGYRPNPKYIEVAPFYPFGQGALVASMRSYTEYSPDRDLELSAKNSKALVMLAAPGPQTVDIGSALTLLDSRNPQVAHGALNPLVSLRTVQNAGNLPNPTGLDNGSINRFQ